MKFIHMLHQGKMYQGLVSYEHEDFMEIAIENTQAFTEGDPAVCLDFKRRLAMRVLHITPTKIIVAPEAAEIFHIEARPRKVFEELFGERQTEPVKQFKLNTFATITDDFQTTAVRVTDVSRMGIGFEINDFSIKMHQVYHSTLICDDECIHPKLIVRYAHILEKTIRYGAELHSISDKDLNKLRYYIVTEQFKQLMLI